MADPVSVEATQPAPLTLPELMEIYKIAVEEYRFQVKLNADRSRDFLVLNSAIIAAAVALLAQSRLLAGAVFGAGLLVAVLAGLATHTQHNYYRETRDTKQHLEMRLGITALVVETTPTTGSRRRRLGSVTNFNYTILLMLFAVDLIGALFSFSILPLPVTPKSTQPPPAIATPAKLNQPQLHPPPSKPSPSGGAAPSATKPP